MSKLIVRCAALAGLLLMGACSRRKEPAVKGPPARPPDAYDQVAQATGGQVFRIDREELKRSSGSILSELVGSQFNRETVLFVHGPLPGAQRRFSVPIDSWIESVSFSVSASKGGKASLELLGPDVRPLASGPGLARTDFGNGSTLEWSAPKPGIYELLARGTGDVTVSVQAKTGLFFVSFEVVRPGGRPAHEGLFKYDGALKAGAEETVRAVLASETVSQAAFSLISEDGTELAPLALKPAEGGSASSGEFVGPARIPSRPFRALVRGKDVHGKDFQRVLSRLFEPGRSLGLDEVHFGGPRGARPCCPCWKTFLGSGTAGKA